MQHKRENTIPCLGVHTKTPAARECEYVNAYQAQTSRLQLHSNSDTVLEFKQSSRERDGKLN
jgi:hypothetical protein